MTKRRTHPNGTGKGRHGQEVQPDAKRPAGQIKPIISKSKHGKMISNFHNTDDDIGPDFAGARRVLKGCLWLSITAAILSVAMCGATVAHGQNAFSFEAKSVYLILEKQPPKAFGPLPVSAWADTLMIGPESLPLIRLYNVTWTRTDNGNMYYMAPGVQIRYEAGPGGKTLYLRAGTAVVEAYELITDKI